MNLDNVVKCRNSRDETKYLAALIDLLAETETTNSILLPIFTIKEIQELSPEVPQEFFATLEKEWIDSCIMGFIDDD